MATIVARAQIEAEADTRFIRGERVNLRAGPSLDEEILAVLKHGTPVFPELIDSDWVLVRTTAGPLGWVHAGLLR